MELTINSRKLNRSITLSRPDRYYIYADLNGQPGTLGEQIRNNTGYIHSYEGEDRDGFEKVCRRWYRAHVREMDRF